MITGDCLPATLSACAFPCLSSCAGCPSAAPACRQQDELRCTASHHASVRCSVSQHTPGVQEGKGLGFRTGAGTCSRPPHSCCPDLLCLHAVVRTNTCASHSLRAPGIAAGLCVSAARCCGRRRVQERQRLRTAATCSQQLTKVTTSAS